MRPVGAVLFGEDGEHRTEHIRRGMSPVPALVLMRRAILTQRARAAWRAEHPGEGGEAEAAAAQRAMAAWRAEHPAEAEAEDEALAMAADATARSAAAPPVQSPAAPAEEIARRMRAAGAPRERVEDWLKPRGAPADRLVREWLGGIERPGAAHILVLTGKAGAGKTVAALDAMAWAFRAKSRGPAHYAPMRESVALGRWGEQGARWEEIREAMFLLLDEAVGGLDEYRRDRIDELLCARYDSGRPTVVTTNLAPAVILDKERGPFGERVASRMGDKRAVCIAECGTVDLRRQKP